MWGIVIGRYSVAFKWVWQGVGYLDEAGGACAWFGPFIVEWPGKPVPQEPLYCEFCGPGAATCCVCGRGT